MAAEAPLVPLGMAGGCSTRAHALTCQPCHSSLGLEPSLQPPGPWEAAQGSPLTPTAPRRQVALRGMTSHPLVLQVAQADPLGLGLGE